MGAVVGLACAQPKEKIAASSVRCLSAASRPSIRTLVVLRDTYSVYHQSFGNFGLLNAKIIAFKMRK
jgi:hypothetical protein